jgi:hypothetical protein
MASSKELTILINAKDNASKEITGVNKALSGIASVAKTAALAIGAIAGGFAYALKETTDASNQLNNSLIGLNSVAKAFKQDTDKAKQAAIELSKDGLMSIKDSAAGLKNLLATGFSLPEATKLMYAFKDSAAFNRQGTLEFGQAIEGATQGIKNQNSILVDNAGITKNLSIILKEAGYSQQDLMNVTSDASVRQALYNGLLKEASIFTGDAARMSGTLSGKQAALSTQVFMLKAAIGEGLTPIMSFFVDMGNKTIAVLGGPEGLKAKAELVTAAFFSLVDGIKQTITVLNELVVSMGIFQSGSESMKQRLFDLLEYIDQRTGVITILRTAWNDVATVFTAYLQPAFDRFWAAIQPLMPAIKLLAELVGLVLYGALIAFVKLLEVSVIAAITFLSNAINGASIIIKTFIDYWKMVGDTIKGAVDWIERAISALKKLNVAQGAYNLVSGALGFGGGKAIGGSVSSGTAYMVGEQGPELFVPSSGGSIIPNNKLGGGVTINITGNTLLDSRAAELIGNMLVQKLSLSAKL